jgi:hypothetical protein
LCFTLLFKSNLFRLVDSRQRPTDDRERPLTTGKDR